MRTRRNETDIKNQLILVLIWVVGHGILLEEYGLGCPPWQISSTLHEHQAVERQFV